MIKFFLALLTSLGLMTKGQVAVINTPPLPIGPLGQTYSWTLDFQEEFSGTAIDYTNTWSPCIYWGIAPDGCWENTSNLEWYKQANVTVANDIARIQGQHVANFTTSTGTFSYTSGFLTTDRNSDNLADTVNKIKYDFQYGYAEIRAKVPAGKGIWPAFWLLPTNHENGEIDVMEILGNHPETNYMTYHWDSATGQGLQVGKSYTGTDFSQDYHTYSVDWDQTAITWYIDGVERQKLVYVTGATLPTSYTALYQNGVEVVTSRVMGANILPQKRLALIANLQVGGDWAGAPDATTPFPANYDIDYIRVWKKGAALPSATPSPTPTPMASPSPSAVPTATPTSSPTPTPSINPSPTPSPTVIPTLSPSATPTPSPTPTPTPTINQLQNPSFENNLASWSLNLKIRTRGGMTRDTTTSTDGSASVKISIDKNQINRWFFSQWSTEFSQSELHLIKGQRYTLSFMAKASSPTTIGLIVQKNYGFTDHISPAFMHYTHHNVPLTTSWAQYNLTFTAPATVSDAKVAFEAGNKTGDIWFDQLFLSN